MYDEMHSKKEYFHGKSLNLNGTFSIIIYVIIKIQKIDTTVKKPPTLNIIKVGYHIIVINIAFRGDCIKDITSIPKTINKKILYNIIFANLSF